MLTERTENKGEENLLGIQKHVFEALIISHLHFASEVAGCPTEMLARSIKDIRLVGDMVLITYEDKGSE